MKQRHTAIEDEAKRVGLALSAAQVRSCLDFAELALRWNARIQLTATRDIEEFLERHVLDSLHLAAAIPLGASRLVDVGSGGGLPGLVVAITRPELDVTLLEPVRKKHAFLAAARRDLALTNVRALPERDEDHDPGAGYDAAVARAVWSVPEWLRRGQRLVRPGGTVLAMEGREEHALPAGAERRPYELGQGRRRAIVVLRVDGVSRP